MQKEMGRIKKILSKWVLQYLTANEVQAEVQAITDVGMCTDALLTMAYDPVDTNEEIDVLLRKVAGEYEIDYPSIIDACNYFIGVYARDIVENKLTPIEGAKYIYQRIMCEYDGYIVEAEAFEELVSEYDDFSSEGNMEFYGKSKCATQITRIEMEIITLAKKIIVSNKNKMWS